VYTPVWRATADSLSLPGNQKFGEDARPGTQNINNTAQRQNIGFASWLGYEKTVSDAHNFSGKLLGYTSSLTVNDVYQPTTNSHLALQAGYNYKHKCKLYQTAGRQQGSVFAHGKCGLVINC
jgi:hypothetical protein